MKTLNEHLALPYRMEIVEDHDEGGFVVSYPDLSDRISLFTRKELTDPICQLALFHFSYKTSVYPARTSSVWYTPSMWLRS